MNKRIHHFEALCFSLSSTPQVFTKLCFVIEVDSPKRYSISLVSGRLASRHGLSVPSTREWLSPSPVLARLGDYHNMEKSDLKYHRMLMNTFWGRVYPNDSYHQVQRGSIQVPVIPWAYSKAVATASWLHCPSVVVYPSQEAHDVSAPVAVKGPLVLCGRESQQAITYIWSLQKECRLMASGRSPNSRNPVSLTATTSASLYRCISEWLGRAPSGAGCSWDWMKLEKTSTSVVLREIKAVRTALFT